jgi:hypothetical protein
MQQITKTLSILILFAALASPALGQVEMRQNRTDEFTGDKIIQTRFVPIDVQSTGDELLYRHESSLFYNEGKWFLVFSTTSDSWAFLDADTAYFLIDGERFERDLMSTDRNVRDGGSVAEQNAVVLDEEIRSAMAQSESVRMKANQYVFDISAAVDEEIQAIANEL